MKGWQYVGNPVWKPEHPKQPTIPEIIGVILVIVTATLCGFALGIMYYGADKLEIFGVIVLALLSFILAHFAGDYGTD